jgi:protein SCO1
MTALKIIRYTAWAAVAALAIVAGLVAFGMKPGGSNMPLAVQIGGPFALTSHEGKRFTDKDLAGKPFALFFGFANCPDICPTTLLELTNRMTEIGAPAKDLRIVFVTVDPEQDTPAFLKTYLSNFDPRIIGLTGTPAEIADIAKAYRALYQKVPTSTGYTMNHEAAVYLMDKTGRFVGSLNYQEPADVQRRKLERFLAAG